MARIKGEDGSVAEVTVAAGVKRERRWENGIQQRRWCNRFPVLMMVTRHDKTSGERKDTGFIQRVPYSRYQEVERDGKARLMDPWESTIIQNQFDQYVFCKAEDAEERERMHKAHIMQPNEPDYMRARHLALGLDPDGGFKRGEMIQRNGQACGIEDIGRFDTDRVLKAGAEFVKDMQVDDKTGLIIENLPDPASFAGKNRPALR